MQTVDALLVRARSAAAQGIKYRLGSGGMDPHARLPANMNNECDCSGFVCWALGLSRQTDHPLYVKFNGGWINTDAIVHDARTPTGFFSELDQPAPGCVVVFPSSPPARKVGHIGLVTSVALVDGVRSIGRVIHCSHGNSAAGDAIRETDAAVFRTGDALLAWYAGVRVEEPALGISGR